MEMRYQRVRRTMYMQGIRVSLAEGDALLRLTVLSCTLQLLLQISRRITTNGRSTEQEATTRNGKLF